MCFQQPSLLRSANLDSSVPIHMGFLKRVQEPFALATRGLGSLETALNRTGSPSLFSVASAAAGELVISPGSIVSGFGQSLAMTTEVATTLPLPTQMGGVSVEVTDRGGAVRLAELFFVSPNQFNFFISEDTSLGDATVEVVRDSQVIAEGAVRVIAVAPGIFTANGADKGPLRRFSSAFVAASSWMKALCLIRLNRLGTDRLSRSILGMKMSKSSFRFSGPACGRRALSKLLSTGHRFLLPGSWHRRNSSA